MLHLPPSPFLRPFARTSSGSGSCMPTQPLTCELRTRGGFLLGTLGPSTKLRARFRLVEPVYSGAGAGSDSPLRPVDMGNVSKQNRLNRRRKSLARTTGDKTRNLDGNRTKKRAQTWTAPTKKRTQTYLPVVERRRGIAALSASASATHFRAKGKMAPNVAGEAAAMMAIRLSSAMTVLYRALSLLETTPCQNMRGNKQ
jgi:hypothetical protein